MWEPQLQFFMPRICGTLTLVDSSTTRAISVRERRLGVRGGGVMKSPGDGGGGDSTSSSLQRLVLLVLTIVN